MAWYSAGSVTVTSGSATVTGANTDFVSNVFPGDAFIGPDGRSYEIARVVSAAELALAKAYAGATAGGQPFSVQPTQDYSRTLALRAGALVTDFSAILDGVGRGLFGDGTQAAPGIRFAADPDTGLRRWAANAGSLVGGGVDALLFGPSGVTLFSGNTRSMVSTANGVAVDTGKGLHWSGSGSEILIPSDGLAGWVWQTDGRITIRSIAGVEKAIFPAVGGLTLTDGNLLAGVSVENQHTLAKNVAQGQPVLMAKTTGASGQPSFVACGVVNYTPSGAGAAVYFGHHSASGRSINAGGTINASGADYAEYMTKAAGCGTIAAGEVCGVNADGRLTRTWADAVSFVVKSTDPAYVGGDIWAADLPSRPEAPGAAPVEPAAPPPKPEDEGAQDAWRAIVDAYPAAHAAWRTAQAEWQAATTAYERDLPAWEAALEAERVKVDRVAFCGQVPVNVDAETLAGCKAALAEGEACYLVAVARGAGIGVLAVREASMTLPLYMRRLGKVWAIHTDRPWIDVQHG